MATDTGRVKSAEQVNRYDTFVAAQLTRAERRIRLLDVTTALLGFLALTCGYAVLMVLINQRVDLPLPVRQLAFFGYLLGAGIYLGFLVFRPLARRINPYYAARQVEQTLPGAKNSVVNWLDLHEQNLAPSVKGAIGQRAAKDLAHADLEQAISGRRTGWVGGLAALLGFALVVTFMSLGSRVFFGLLARSFIPFPRPGQPLTRTLLTLVRPEGDVVVPVGRPVSFQVKVEGKVPNPRDTDAVRLLFRYQETESYLERPFQQEPTGEWTALVSAFDAQNGFWYKVAGGDAETPEYRVRVRSTPLVTDFRALYHFRDYTARPPELTHERKLEAVRGTRVELHVHTNRTLKEGFIDFETKDERKHLRGEPLSGDPQAFKVSWVLEESGQYRLGFTSTEDESFYDAASFPVTALPDLAPEVVLTSPAKDVQLPANGLLKLEGSSTDDFGVKSLRLLMQVAGGAKLEPRPYRSEEALRLKRGGYPLSVEYKDFVELVKVRGAGNKPVNLEAGTVLEYWLEASDACDFPRPNVGESRHYRVTLTEPIKDEQKQKKEQDQAQKEKKDHEARQDDKLKQEDQARQKEARDKQEARDREERKPDGQKNQDNNQDGGDQNKGNPSGENPDSKNNQPENGAGGANQDAPNNPNGQPNPEQQKQEQQVRDQERRLEEALNKKDQQEKQEPNQEKGPKRGDGQQSPGQDPQPKPGEAKEGGKPNDRDKPGEAKDKGDPKNNPGEDPQKGENRQGTEAGKPEGDKTQPQPQSGEAKDKRQQENKPEGGKPENAGQKPDDKQRPDDKKPMGDNPQPQPQSGEAKDKGQQGKKPEGGPAKDQEQKPDDKQGSRNQGNTKPDAMKNAAQPKDQGQAGAKPEAPKDKGQEPGKPEGPSGMKKENVGEKKEGDPKNQGANQPPGQPKEQGQPAPQTKPGETKEGSSNGKTDGQGQQPDSKSPPAKAEEKELGKAEPTQGQPKPSEKGGGDKESSPKPASGAEPQGTPKEGKPDQKPASEKTDKPGPMGKDAVPAEAKPDDKKNSDGNQGDRKDLKEAMTKRLQDLAKDLQGSDPQKKEEARKELEKLARAARDQQTKEELDKLGQKTQDKSAAGDDPKKQEEEARKLALEIDKALDPQARDALRKEMEQTAPKSPESPKGGESQKNEDKKDPLGQAKPSNPTGEPCAECKGGGSGEGGKPGEGKPGGAKPATSKEGSTPSKPSGSEEQGSAGKGQEENKDKPGSPEGKPGKEAGSKGNEPAKDGAGKQPGADRGEQVPGKEAGTEKSEKGTGKEPGSPLGGGGRPGLEEPPQGDEEVKPQKPAKPRDPRAGVLQIEDFKKKVDKKVLQDARMSEEEFREFLKAYEAMLKRQAPQPGAKEAPVAPQQGGPLQSIGARKVQPSDPTKGSDPSAGGKGKPPPGYGNAFKEFTRQLATPAGADKPEKK